jgi:hypothetical protein
MIDAPDEFNQLLDAIPPIFQIDLADYGRVGFF